MTQEGLVSSNHGASMPDPTQEGLVSSNYGLYTWPDTRGFGVLKLRSDLTQEGLVSSNYGLTWHKRAWCPPTMELACLTRHKRAWCPPTTELACLTQHTRQHSNNMLWPGQRSRPISEARVVNVYLKDQWLILWLGLCSFRGSGIAHCHTKGACRLWDNKELVVCQAIRDL